MDFLAALDAQQIHRIGGESNVDFIVNNNENAIDLNVSPKEVRKLDSKKRWKNWGFKYSPGGKTASIEEEPIEISSAKTSRHSSPTNSPKHKKSSDTTTAATVVANLLNQSPLRRRNQGTNQLQNQFIRSNTSKGTNGTNVMPSSNINRNEIRSSAGARLCQTLENLQDDGIDEFQALIINGRPASVHIIPMSSTQMQ